MNLFCYPRAKAWATGRSRWQLMLLAFFGIALSTSPSKAQNVNGYTVSTFTGSALEDISTGSTQIFAGGTGATTGMGAAIRLPFPFIAAPGTTGGTANVQDYFAVGSGGVVRLSSGPGNTVSANTIFANGEMRLAALANNSAPAGSVGLSIASTGKVHYKVTGTAPNRRVVIEWNKVRINQNSTNTTNGDGTFQVRLHETTGIIDFAYSSDIAVGPNTVNTGGINLMAGLALAGNATYANVANTNRIAWVNFADPLTPVIADGTGAPFENLVTTGTPLTNLQDRVIRWTPPAGSHTAPSALTLTAATKSSLNVTWTLGAGATNQFLFYKKSTDTDWIRVRVTDNNTAPGATIIGGLEPSTNYDIWVANVSNGGFFKTATNIFSTNTANPPIKESNATGIWTTASTWVGGVVPQPGDSVIIKSGHTVSFQASGAQTIGTAANPLAGIYVESGATLRYNTIASFTGAHTVNVFNITVDGTFNMEPSATSANATHPINLYGNLQVNGPTQFYNSTNASLVANVSFLNTTRETPQLISGSGSVGFNLMTINRGIKSRKVLNTNAGTTFRQLVGNRSVFTLTSGTYEQWDGNLPELPNANTVNARLIVGRDPDLFPSTPGTATTTTVPSSTGRYNTIAYELDINTTGNVYFNITDGGTNGDFQLSGADQTYDWVSGNVRTIGGRFWFIGARSTVNFTGANVEVFLGANAAAAGNSVWRINSGVTFNMTAGTLAFDQPHSGTGAQQRSSFEAFGGDIGFVDGSIVNLTGGTIKLGGIAGRNNIIGVLSGQSNNVFSIYAPNAPFYNLEVNGSVYSTGTPFLGLYLGSNVTVTNNLVLNTVPVVNLRGFRLTVGSETLPGTLTASSASITALNDDQVTPRTGKLSILGAGNISLPISASLSLDSVLIDRRLSAGQQTVTFSSAVNVANNGVFQKGRGLISAPSIGYGTNATLEYTSSQVALTLTTANEWPASGGPTSVKVNMTGASSGISLPASFTRTVNSQVIIVDGSVAYGTGAGITWGSASVLEYANPANGFTHTASAEWPTSGSNVPSIVRVNYTGTGTPTLTTGGARVSNNLDLLAGVLNVSSGNLEVRSDITGTGTQNGSSNIVLTTKATGNLLSNVILQNLTLNNPAGASISGTGNILAVTGTLTLTSGVFSSGDATNQLGISNAISGSAANLAPDLRLRVEGTGTFITLPAVSSLGYLGIYRANNPGAFAARLSANLVLNEPLDEALGNLDLNGFTLTVLPSGNFVGTGSQDQNTGSPTPIANGTPAVVNNLTVDLDGGVLNLTSNVVVNGKLTIKNGGINLNGFSLTFGSTGNVEYNNLTAPVTSGPEILPAAAAKGIRVNNAGQTVTLGANSLVAGNLTLTSGSALNSGGFTLEVRGDVANAGTISNDAGSLLFTTKGSAHNLSGTGTYGASIISNNTNGLTFPGPKLTHTGSLTLTAGNLTIPANGHYSFGGDAFAGTGSIVVGSNGDIELLANNNSTTLPTISGNIDSLISARNGGIVLNSALNVNVVRIINRAPISGSGSINYSGSLRRLEYLNTGGTDHTTGLEWASNTNATQVTITNSAGRAIVLGGTAQTYNVANTPIVVNSGNLVTGSNSSGNTLDFGATTLGIRLLNNIDSRLIVANSTKLIYTPGNTSSPNSFIGTGSINDPGVLETQGNASVTFKGFGDMSIPAQHQVNNLGTLEIDRASGILSLRDLNIGTKLVLRSGTLGRAAGVLTLADNAAVDVYNGTQNYSGANFVAVGSYDLAFKTPGTGGPTTTLWPSGSTAIRNVTLERAVSMNIADAIVSGTLSLGGQVLTLTGGNITTNGLTTGGGRIAPATTSTVTINRSTGTVSGWPFGPVVANLAAFRVTSTSATSLTASADLNVQGLTVETGNTINLGATTITISGGTAPTNGLAVNGALTSLGTSGNLVFAGSNAASVTGTGNISVWTLTQNNSGGLTIASGTSVKVRSALTLGGTSSTIVTGELRLVSDNTFTANLTQITGSPSFVGNLTTERFIPSRGGARWVYLGANTTGRTFADYQDDANPQTGFPGAALGATPGTGNNLASAYFYSPLTPFNNANLTEAQGWRVPASISSAVNPGTGFRMWLRGSFFNSASKFVQAGGLVAGQNRGNVNLTLSKCLVGAACPYEADNGWNFIANPYPSVLDWDAVVASNPTMNNSYYFLYQTSSTALSYVYYATGIGSTPASGLTATRYIPSGQGFFLLANTNGEVINLSEAHKATNLTTFVRTGSQAATLRVRLTRSGQEAECLVGFLDGMSRGRDLKDAPHGGGTFSVGTFSATGAVNAINALPMPGTTDSVVVYTQLDASGAYTLSLFDIQRMPAGYTYYIKDRYLGTVTPVQENDVVNFTVSSVQGSRRNDRFVIYLTAQTTSLGTLTSAKASMTVFPNPASESAQVKVAVTGLKEGAAEVVVFDALGREVAREALNLTSSDLSTYELKAKLSAGVYTLSLRTSGQALTSRLVVE